MRRQYVRWQRTRNVSLDALGSTMTKTIADNWNANGCSELWVESFPAELRYVADGSGGYRMFGFSRGDNTPGSEPLTTYHDIDYCMSHSIGALAVYEGGVSKAAESGLVAGDQLSVEIDASGVVRYKKNGVTKYTSLVTAVPPLLCDTAMFTQGLTLKVQRSGLWVPPPAASTEAVVWTGMVNATADGSTITKSGGGAAYNGGGRSTRAIQFGDGYAEWTVGPTVPLPANSFRICGLARGDTNQAPGDVDWGWSLDSSTGNCLVYESGTLRYTGPAVALGDVLRVSVESGVPKYYRNGGLLYTSAGRANYPLNVDCSLYGDGVSVVQNAVISGVLAAA